MEEKDFLKKRGVYIPCPKCAGYGVRFYGSGATWRGGVGTASCERDICDECWGTGDFHRKGTDIRKLENALKSKEASDCANWLMNKTGINFKFTRGHWKHLLERLDKEQNRRKLPEGINSLHYHSTVESLKKTLSDMIKSMEDEEDVKDVIE